MILHSKKGPDGFMTGFDVPNVPQRRMKGTSCRMVEGYVSNVIKNIKRSNHMDEQQNEKCKTCEYREPRQGGYCYMFQHSPYKKYGWCLKHTPDENTHKEEQSQ